MPDTVITTIGAGKIGGKGNGFVRLERALTGIASLPCAARLALPATTILATDIFEAFLSANNLDREVQAAESGGTFDEGGLKERFLAGRFPPEIEREFAAFVDSTDAPLAVRSSSLLEDQKGASFAGKYESVFIGNQGAPQERLAQLMRAIKGVYASTYNASALAYRAKHGFLGDREAMACLMQKVVGRRYRNCFLPALAGVAFSQNGYCWNKEIRKSDGLVRLVMGLGTRAVGRGYVRLFSPVKPLMRPEGTEVNNIQKCSQKKVDVIDLTSNTLAPVHFRELITNGFECVPGAQAFVSLRDGNYLYRPVSNLWDGAHVPVLTMDGIFTGDWMGMDIAATFRDLLPALEKALRFAVDLEFAIDVDPEQHLATLFLLQARALSEGENRKPLPIPEIASPDIIFSVKRNLPTAAVADIEYLVAVDDAAYHAWPHNDKPSIARVVGKITEALKGRRFALIGPGRWGSWNPELGVPVTYAEIAGSAMLVEVARRRATYVPEVSFGSHFFQDLIEDNIAYLPLYPDEPGEIFNEEIFRKRSSFAELLPDPYFRKFDGLIRVIDVPAIADGRRAHAILNGEVEKAVVFLK